MDNPQTVIFAHHVEDTLLHWINRVEDLTSQLELEREEEQTQRTQYTRAVERALEAEVPGSPELAEDLARQMENRADETNAGEVDLADDLVTRLAHEMQSFLACLFDEEKGHPLVANLRPHVYPTSSDLPWLDQSGEGDPQGIDYLRLARQLADPQTASSVTPHG